MYLLNDIQCRDNGFASRTKIKKDSPSFLQDNAGLASSVAVIAGEGLVGDVDLSFSLRKVSF